MAGIDSVQYLDGEKEETTSITRAGKVKVICRNGDKFEGTYVERADGQLVKDGQGKYTWKSGASYKGEYKDNKKHGNGTYTNANGAQYSGSWYQGCKNGFGKETFPNGDSFTGRWADDRKNGPGVYTYSSGAVLSGEWEDGELVDGKWELGDKRLSTKSILMKLGRRLSSARRSAKRSFSKRRPLGIIISGAPASGKGTQCEFIREEFGVIHLSTGDMLRAAVAAGTELGLRAKELMEAGQLVPDEVVIGAVKERLLQEDVLEHGFLLDGFPRTPAQAKALMQCGIQVDAFIMLNVPEELLVSRVVGRRIDPETGNSYHVDFNPPPPEIEERVIQRADDTKEKVVVRLEAFHKNISSVKSFYTAVMAEIDGSQSKDEVWGEIRTCLEAISGR